MHCAQVLEGADGAQAAGWPAFHKSKVHASPLLYDVDGDGVQDILVPTYDGEVLAFRDTVRSPPSILLGNPDCTAESSLRRGCAMGEYCSAKGPFVQILQ